MMVWERRHGNHNIARSICSRREFARVAARRGVKDNCVLVAVVVVGEEGERRRSGRRQCNEEGLLG